MKFLGRTILLLLLLFYTSTLSFGQRDFGGDGGSAGIEGCDDWWEGPCGITSSVFRTGRVHIGGVGDAHPSTKLQLTGDFYIKDGELRGLRTGESQSFIIKAAEAGASGGSYFHLYGENNATAGGRISVVTRGGENASFRVTHNNAAGDWLHNFTVKPDGEMIGRRSLQLNTDDAEIPFRVKTEQWGQDRFSVKRNGETYATSFRVGPNFWHPDWDHFKVLENGKVIVGDAAEAPAGFLLSVAEGIQTQRVRVCASAEDWCDYVFEEEYALNTIEEVDAYIKEHKHLPNVPSAQEVETNGINVAEMDAILLRQVEELWLHMVELKKENQELKKEVGELVALQK